MDRDVKDPFQTTIQLVHLDKSRTQGKDQKVAQNQKNTKGSFLLDGVCWRENSSSISDFSISNIW